MTLLPSVPTKLNADNEDKQLKEPIMGNYDLGKWLSSTLNAIYALKTLEFVFIDIGLVTWILPGF